MGIGASVFLIALGLILALAVEAEVAGVDIQMIGWIMALAGAIGLVVALAVFGPRRRRVTVVESPTRFEPTERRVVEERRYDEPL
jgi:membrane associated rhomboid family serine protease